MCILDLRTNNRRKIDDATTTTTDNQSFLNEMEFKNKIFVAVCNAVTKLGDAFRNSISCDGEPKNVWCMFVLHTPHSAQNFKQVTSMYILYMILIY